VPQTGFVYHPDYLLHDTGGLHPESPERLRAIHHGLKESELWETLVHVQVPAQPRVDIHDWIQRVHRPSHLKRIQSHQPQSGLDYLDADTIVSPRSYRVALLAVEGLLTAVDEVMSRKIKNVFCAVRPPGHHAESNRAMGFCLFNNVAVAVRYLQERYGLGRILIIDWDVHHGNGTQEIFYEDPTVFYFSVHQYPLYPGTGRSDEHGKGAGDGYTLNCPLPPGKGDDEYISVFEKVLKPAVEAFQPDFIFISAGFDAHRDDPLANMRVTEEGFDGMTRLVSQWAGRHCEGRIVSCLEGGYNLPALARSVETHLRTLMKGEDPA
jgi:acetoin utilization deacetylase AcuC-like enzyme